MRVYVMRTGRGANHVVTLSRDVQTKKRAASAGRLWVSKLREVSTPRQQQSWRRKI